MLLFSIFFQFVPVWKIKTIYWINRVILFSHGYNSVSNNWCPNTWSFESLKNIFKIFFSNRIPYGSHIIPFHLCQDLDTAKTCVCGRYSISSFIQGTTTMNLHSVAHTVVLVDNMGGTEAPVISYFCSLACDVNSCDMFK